MKDRFRDIRATQLRFPAAAAAGAHVYRHESLSSEVVKYARGFPPFLQAHWVNSFCVNSFLKKLFIYRKVSLIWANIKENLPELGTELI